MTSEIPEATELLGVDVADGTATVDLSAAFESGGAACRCELRVAQVVCPHAVPHQDEVRRPPRRLRRRGDRRRGVPADGPTWADFENVTPLISGRGARPSGLRSRRPSSCRHRQHVEANVRYTITGADGTVLADGFTTATAGTGTWAPSRWRSISRVGRPGRHRHCVRGERRGRLGG
ncbi:MAG: GerMN domain-containing protein [Microthrixaceae bacterium]|nr:GerMN domain-containing protein [Microthrixaceae bacterium]